MLWTPSFSQPTCRSVLADHGLCGNQLRYGRVPQASERQPGAEEAMSVFGLVYGHTIYWDITRLSRDMLFVVAIICASQQIETPDNLFPNDSTKRFVTTK
jgi:hypothetical protein